jgi:putative pyoverdin transport system ATP-binding/permease protein
MTLWRYLAAETAVSKLRLLTFLALSGITNSLLMVIINYAAQDAAEDGAGSRMILLFAVALVLYLASQKFILRVAAYEVEHIVERLRVRLASVIRHADLLPVEHVGASRIFGGITKETLTLSQSALPMMIACQSAVMVVVSVVFIAIVSPVALILVLVIIGLGVLVHLRNIESGKQDLQSAYAKENDLFDALTDLLQGMKEVRLNEARNDALFREIQRVAAAVAERKTSAGMQFASQYMFSQALFYLLMASMVFILPRLATIEGATISIITGAILFIIGPLSSLVAAIPVFSGATVALTNIMQLEAELSRYQEEARPSEPAMAEHLRGFASITFRQIEFLHKDSRGETTFRMGPINFDIRRGEMVFLVGGNGSGKSTLLKVITALYRPGGGRILVDGQALTRDEYPAYRSCFAAIFSDYHLFSRMYGLENVADEQVQSLLKLMRLEEKTAFRNGRFETQELSTGQRKRLAMIVALLEDRPFYVLDEWAADQDPEFREFFYKELLTRLKKEGKTLLLATHDDRYFHLADRVYRMENGQLSPLTVARDPGEV